MKIFEAEPSTFSGNRISILQLECVCFIFSFFVYFFKEVDISYG